MPKLVTALFQHLKRFTFGGEAGEITTGVALFSLIAGSTLLASTVVAEGDFGTEALAQAMQSGLTRSSGTIVTNGAVVVTASGAPLTLDSIRIRLGTIGTVEGVSLADGAGSGLMVSYIDNGHYVADAPFSYSFLSGDDDDLLETGEQVEIKVALAALASVDGAPNLKPGSRWTLQLESPVGGTLSVSRTMPFGIDPVMALP